MNCEMDYCIFNRNFKCTLENIEIISLGMCTECIIIALDKDFLDAEKINQL